MIEKKKSAKPPSSKKQRHFMEYMRNGISNWETLESPMAVYDWFVSEWDRPLNLEGMRQAWLAAWAISIDDGMVQL